MPTHVTLDAELFAKQGMKVAIGPDGRPEQVPPGRAPQANAQILMREGDPAFEVRATTSLRSDVDVPDDLGLAMRRVTERLAEAGDTLSVEWAFGPYLHDGALVLYLDTDGRGFSDRSIDAMAAVLVEELEPLAMALHIGVPGRHDMAGGRPWQSSVERSD